MTRNRLIDPVAEAEAFNAAVKVGDTIEFRAHPEAEPKRFTTSTPAEVLGGHSAVVWLNGKSGCVATSHCKPIAA